jgi:hypothetical protein
MINYIVCKGLTVGVGFLVEMLDYSFALPTSNTALMPNCHPRIWQSEWFIQNLKLWEILSLSVSDYLTFRLHAPPYTFTTRCEEKDIFDFYLLSVSLTVDLLKDFD